MRVAAGVVDLRVALVPSIDEDEMPSEVWEQRQCVSGCVCTYVRVCSLCRMPLGACKRDRR